VSSRAARRADGTRHDVQRYRLDLTDGVGVAGI
jgi:hypothetical protein